MKKAEAIQKMIELISKIELNTFLFPKGWGDDISMINEDWTYKTYNSGGNGSRRYHNIQISRDGEPLLSINFSGDDITVTQAIQTRAYTAQDLVGFIEAIFNEMHSFSNHDEGRRKIREGITKQKQCIKECKEKIKDLEQRLSDSFD